MKCLVHKKNLQSLTKLDIMYLMKSWTPDEIKDLRGKHGLSQPAFGDLIGVTGNYVYLLEKGVKNPSKTLQLLLDCIEEKFNEKGKEKVKHGKRHL